LALALPFERLFERVNFIVPASRASHAIRPAAITQIGFTRIFGVEPRHHVRERDRWLYGQLFLWVSLLHALNLAKYHPTVNFDIIPA